MASKYRLSRRGKKLQISDDPRILIALPKDVPERTWAEILQKEENDLFIFDLREEIVDEAIKICYDRYMERQTASFTAHCASLAWMKLLDWHFFRHDPGEDPTAFPPCSIPKRTESWTPDEMPEPSPKDSWARNDLDVTEEVTEQVIRKWPSNTSLNYAVVQDIPEKYWFPGKVRLAGFGKEEEKLEVTYSFESDASDKTPKLIAESEVLQKVTDYSTEELLSMESVQSHVKPSSPVDISLGAGDATTDKIKKRSCKNLALKKQFSFGKSKIMLAPLDFDSKSKISIISDCRLRNPRLDTQYEISSEKIDTPPGQPNKRK